MFGFTKGMAVFLAAITSAMSSAQALAAPPLESYGKLPELETAVISPSGELFAMAATINGKRLIMIYSADKLVQSVALGNAKLRDMGWATNELLMVDISQTLQLSSLFNVDKTEHFKTLFISTVNEEVKLLFARQKKLTNATFGWYGIRQFGGKTYGFFGAIPLQRAVETGTRQGELVYMGGIPSLYRVDLSNMKATEISGRAATGYWKTWRVGADGNIAATLNFRGDGGDWNITNGDGRVIASGKSPDGQIDLTSIGKNGDTIIFQDDVDDDGNHEFFEVSLNGGNKNRLFEEKKIDRFYRERLTGRLLGYRLGDLKRTTVFFDQVQNKNVKKIAAAFPKLNARIENWSDNLAKVVATTNGNKDSGTWWEVNLVNPSASPIGFERTKIAPDDVGPISVVSYKAQDGLDIEGILTLPPGREAKDLPVVMLPHGGPRSHDKPVFDWWAQALASRGYAVLQPNFRGSTNSTADFMRAGDGEWGQKMQTDISDGLNYLAKQGIVDPKRACIMGASYGGYAALAGVTLQQGIYRCVVSVNGVSDLPKMVATEFRDSGGSRRLKKILEEQIGKGSDLKAVSPDRFAEQADAPVLLIHGKDDTVVPYNQSTIMADALKDAKKPYEMVPLDGEDHWLSRGETRLKMLQAAVAFVEKHNPPDPAPAKK